MKKFLDGALKYILAVAIVGGAIFWTTRKSLNNTDIQINTQVIKVACAADYPGGCLKSGGRFAGKEIEIIERLFKDVSVEYTMVNVSNIKDQVKSGVYQIGCGGWFIKNDGSIYSLPIITNVKITDIVKGNWTNKDPIFVQSATVPAQYAEEKYISASLRKYDDLMDCINAYKHHQGPKKLIIDSINFDYMVEHNNLELDSFTEHGNYNICLLCKDQATKNDVDLKIITAQKEIENINSRNIPNTNIVHNTIIQEDQKITNSASIERKTDDVKLENDKKIEIEPSLIVSQTVTDKKHHETITDKKTEIKVPEKKVEVKPVKDKKIEVKVPEKKVEAKPVEDKKIEIKVPEKKFEAKPVEDKKIEVKVPEKKIEVKQVEDKKIEVKVPEKKVEVKPVEDKKIEVKVPEKKVDVKPTDSVKPIENKKADIKQVEDKKAPEVKLAPVLNPTDDTKSDVSTPEPNTINTDSKSTNIKPNIDKSLEPVKFVNSDVEKANVSDVKSVNVEKFADDKKVPISNTSKSDASKAKELDDKSDASKEHNGKPAKKLPGSVDLNNINKK